MRVALALALVGCGGAVAPPAQPEPPVEEAPPVKRPRVKRIPSAGKYSRAFTLEDAEALRRLEAACIERDLINDSDVDLLTQVAGVAVGAEGLVVSEFGDAIYGDPEGGNYLGRVSHDARVRYTGGYGFSIHCTTQMKVFVIANEWPEEVGKTGWVGVGDLGDWR